MDLFDRTAFNKIRVLVAQLKANMAESKRNERSAECKRIGNQFSDFEADQAHAHAVVDWLQNRSERGAS